MSKAKLRKPEPILWQAQHKPSRNRIRGINAWVSKHTSTGSVQCIFTKPKEYKKSIYLDWLRRAKGSAGLDGRIYTLPSGQSVKKKSA
jgi:hypothetical protein